MSSSMPLLPLRELSGTPESARLLGDVPGPCGPVFLVAAVLLSDFSALLGVIISEGGVARGRYVTLELLLRIILSGFSSHSV